MKTDKIDIARPLITRIAPSPTGHLHLGHALHLAWVRAVATACGAQIILRLEDHDRSRFRSEFAKSIQQDLRWLGFGSEEKPAFFDAVQSQRLNRYASIAKSLADAGLIYACTCSRKLIATNSGQSGGELHYPGTCRDKLIPLDTPTVSWRVRLPSIEFETDDLFCGSITNNPQTSIGDMVIRERNGNWTYQFAVVIDDWDQNINLIVRGEDLLSSVGRQLALRSLLNVTSPVVFLHHPLLTDAEGGKLSKLRQSPALSLLRDQGLTSEDVFCMALNAAGFDQNNFLPKHVKAKIDRLGLL